MLSLWGECYWEVLRYWARLFQARKCICMSTVGAIYVHSVVLKRQQVSRKIINYLSTGTLPVKTPRYTASMHNHTSYTKMVSYTRLRKEKNTETLFNTITHKSEWRLALRVPDISNPFSGPNIPPHRAKIRTVLKYWSEIGPDPNNTHSLALVAIYLFVFLSFLEYFDHLVKLSNLKLKLMSTNTQRWGY